ncbi:protein kinase [Coniothyrium glycines]
MGSDDLIDFEVIENQKENIQSLPSGRSAKALAQLYTPPLSSGASASASAVHAPSPAQMQDANSSARLEFEKELLAIDESDDPLDVYDRYVKWTLDAYPSAQNTPQSQLCPLLERATKAFQSSPQYKNDVRYLKLWLHYIRLFSDAPRETFAYLARHNIGEGLALYYEEFAAWLESAERFAQAEEIYNLGIEKNARPVERLVRKYGEFQHRLESRPQQPEPSSPALPAVRPALAAKIDPFASAVPSVQQPQSQPRPTAGASRSGKPKLAIFSDENEPARTGSGGSDQGWDSIGSLADRKKENTAEARPWVGETLKVGKKNTGVPKMAIFKDESKSQFDTEKPTSHPLRDHQQAVNPRTGRLEVVIVDLAQVYPNHVDPMSEEYSFEELRAKHRGWMTQDWAVIRREEQEKAMQKASAAMNAKQPRSNAASTIFQDACKEGPTAKGPTMVFSDPVKDVSKRGITPKVFRDIVTAVPQTDKARMVFEDPIEEKPRATTAPVCFRDQTDENADSTGAQTVSKNVAEEAMKSNKPSSMVFRDPVEGAAKPRTVPLKGSVDDDIANDENTPPSQAELEKAKAARKSRREERANRTRKIKVMDVKEIRSETQTIQTNLESPAKPKIRRKKSGREATVTLHTKEAMDEIYDIFSQPLKNPDENASEMQSEDGDESSEDEDDDDAYTSAGESTGTGRISCATSEFGDETTVGDFTLGTRVLDTENDNDSGNDNESDTEDTDVKSVSAWSDFSESKHGAEEHGSDDSDNESANSDESFEAVTHPLTNREAQGDHEADLATPISPVAPASLPTRYVPVPPEDYSHPTRPYKDPTQAANNRLPFMTPIVEKTESSLGFATACAQKEYFAAKTPSRSKGNHVILEDDDEPGSSPFSDLLGSVIGGPGKVAKLSLGDSKTLLVETTSESTRRPFSSKENTAKHIKPDGPIIKDAQCNPVDDAIRKTILQEAQPPLDSYEGYFADTNESYGKGADIRKYTKAMSKMSKNTNDKTMTNLALCPTLQFKGSDRRYTVKRELGKGAFAPVYLVESRTLDDEDSDDRPAQMGKGEFGLKRKPLEAIKMEDPPTPWEFYMMRQARRRLGVSRPAESIVYAYEMHVFKDECYLVEEFRDQGTLLDLVNLARAENGVMDEQLAMFFTVELFRTVEALHMKGIVHGDLKSDNILVRFDTLQKDEHWESTYKRDGRDGWASKGISLIDFGRGIDMRAFKPDVQFIADWPTTEADCAEMRELRPWTYQIDYHGLAGIVHNLLFAKYISTIAERGAALGAGATKIYRIKESLKRYWQTDIWQECFDLLLNPLMHLDPEEGRKLPVLKGMQEVREKMEDHLEANCEKGIGLKALIRKMEEAVKRR